ncbi:MAG: AAA family ATPase [Nitrososphaeraceae archaeon]
MLNLPEFFSKKLNNSIFNNRNKADLFSEIIGYNDIKDIMLMALASESSTAILLSGKPGNGKSSFLKSIEQKYSKYCKYVDCSLTTKAGIRDLLFANSSLKILLLDEISRLRKLDQEILLNLIQDGRIVDIRSNKNNEINFNSLKIFATCNNANKLIPPLRDRFDEYELPLYSYKEFEFICEKLIKNKDPLLRKAIIETAWQDLGSRSIRDVLDICKYVTSTDELNKYIQIKKKYMPTQ